MDIGSIGSIVASGMQAMRTKQDAHAHNLANAQTPGYQRVVVRTTERPEGGVDLSIERDPRPGGLTYAGEVLPQPTSADDPTSAGSSSSIDPSVGSAPDSGAAASSTSQNPTRFVEGSNVDPVEEMIGMSQSVHGMAMLAALYQRADQALGTMFDAFG